MKKEDKNALKEQPKNKTSNLEAGPISPLVSTPVETAQLRTHPVKTQPVETQPVETQPVETQPVETQPVETHPVETHPVETTKKHNTPESKTTSSKTEIIDLVEMANSIEDPIEIFASPVAHNRHLGALGFVNPHPDLLDTVLSGKPPKKNDTFRMFLGPPGTGKTYRLILELKKLLKKIIIPDFMFVRLAMLVLVIYIKELSH